MSDPKNSNSNIISEKGLSSINVLHENQTEKEQDSYVENEQQEQQPQQELPVEQQKNNNMKEIIELNEKIQQKRSLQRKSTFHIQQKKSSESEEEDEDKKDENEASNKETQAQHNQNNLPEKPKTTIQDEIQNVFRSIEKKRSINRQSTFAQSRFNKLEADAITEDEKNEENIQNNENEEEEDKKKMKEKEEQQNKEKEIDQSINVANVVLPQKPQVSIQDEIKKVVSTIEKKKSIQRQSTFSLQKKNKSSDNEREDDDDEDNDQNKDEIQRDKQKEKGKNSSNNTENQTTNKVVEVEGFQEDEEDDDDFQNKKLNNLEQILQLTEEIESKNKSRRQSTFALSKHKDNVEENNQQIKENQDPPPFSKFKEDIIYQSKEQGQVGGRGKEGGDDDDDVDEQSNEHAFKRQQKKKNIMDYKEESKKDDIKPKSKERKMIFFQDQEGGRHRKVIHPIDNEKKAAAQKQVNYIKQTIEQFNLPSNKNKDILDESDLLLDQKGQQQQARKSPNDNLSKKSFDKEQDKEISKERRHEFAALRKLEYLTATSAKNEIVNKKESHKQFMSNQISKEIKIRDANKKKRELEQMLSQLNREIQFMREADPDFEPLQEKIALHRKMDQEKQKLPTSSYQSPLSSIHQNNNDHQQNVSKNSKVRVSQDNLQKKSGGAILPPIKLNNQIKEMIHISEDKEAQQHAISFIQKLRRDKQLFRLKKEEDSSQVDHIEKEIEVRRVQNQSLSEKKTLEKRQMLLHKKQKYEQSKLEQAKLQLASKSFVKDLNRHGPGEMSQQYMNQLQEIDNVHKYGEYTTPELDAYKLGLKELRSISKGQFNGGGSVVHLANNKQKDNSNLKKLLEENQINRQRELNIIQSRNDIYLKNKENQQRTKILSQNLLNPQRKPEISQSLLFAYEEQQQKLNNSEFVTGSKIDEHRASTKLTKVNDNNDNERIDSNNKQSKLIEQKQLQEGEEFNSADINKNLNNSKTWAIKHSEQSKIEQN